MTVAARNPEMNTSHSSKPDPGYGALVVSLDFELHWGVRDTMPVDGPYRENLLGARTAVPRLLDLFEAFDIGATWATVGFLFARTRDELEAYSPAVRPRYRNPSLDPYREPVGRNEGEDPLHYAPTLVEEIRRRPRQELATHTFSHYYCREEGHTEEAFRQDLASAVRIAEPFGVRPRSIVFPRNQFAPEHAPVLREFGITAYRSPERHRIYQGHSTREQRSPWRRGARLLDHYLDLTDANTTPWPAIPQADGLYAIPSSRFLRGYSKPLAALEPLRLKRILDALREAAHTNRIFHLNFHPHNFGVHLEQNLRVLRSILESYRRHRTSHGMRSLSMEEVVAALQRTPMQAEVAA